MTSEAPDEDDAGEPDDHRPRRGSRIGRYLVLDEIGAGGMGIVYRAYDPELNRKVALKVLRPRTRPGKVAVARVRLQREAQTLAKLSHVNVVTVYDVGLDDDRLFVAMELLDGEDLSKWLRRERRSWRESLPLLLEAGRGLAAAHAVMLVHRDFKPSNVLVGADGRVSVTDFGLARTDPTTEVRAGLDGDPEEPTTTPQLAERLVEMATSHARAELPAPAGDLLDLSLTAEGRAVGTPAYMAPEQHMGEPTDARSDQFAFCVATYEAIYGRRPFAGADARTLARAKRAGLEEAPPSRDRTGRRVPRHVRAAIRRGLSVMPSRRFDSLPTLLAALDPTSRQGRWIAGGVAVVSLGVLTMHATIAGGEERDGPCIDPHTRLADVWDEPTQGRIRESFAATRLPYAKHTADRVIQILDRRAEAWMTMHSEACEATWVRGEQSPRLLDLRMACLSDIRRELAATTELLTAADASVVENAAAMAVALPTVDACEDADELQSGAAPPDDSQLASRVEGVLEELSMIRATRRAGRQREARRRITTLVEREGDLPHAATRAELLLLHGMVLDDHGEHERAADVLREATVEARRANHTRVEATAWIELLNVVGSHLHDEDQGRLFAQLGLSALARLERAPRLEAWALAELGELELRVGHDDAAADNLERALALQESTLTEDHVEIGETLVRLAGASFRRGEIETARAQLERAVTIYERNLGEGHPRLAAPMGNLGLVLAQEKKYDEALARLRRGLSLLERAYGAKHPGVANAHDTIGEVLMRTGEHGPARREFQYAVEIFESTVGPEHPAVAAPLLGLGTAALAQGEHEEARKHLERAQALTERVTLPPAQVAETKRALANAVRSADPERAARLDDEAEAALPSDPDAPGQRAAGEPAGD